MSKRKSINVVVVTPEKKALDVSTHAAVIPAHDGEIGILTDRAPAMCELGIGQLRYEREGRTRRMFINGGFAQINETLWAIEDDIRDKERASAFDEGFIELARQVYFTNDRRSAVKRSINEHLGSAIMEEKSYQAY